MAVLSGNCVTLLNKGIELLRTVPPLNHNVLLPDERLTKSIIPENRLSRKMSTYQHNPHRDRTAW
eukprot:COSAG01_NODE_348_length_18498_cov_181.563128_11_plen_65_part_00